MEDITPSRVETGHRVIHRIQETLEHALLNEFTAAQEKEQLRMSASLPTQAQKQKLEDKDKQDNKEVASMTNRERMAQAAKTLLEFHSEEHLVDRYVWNVIKYHFQRYQVECIFVCLIVYLRICLLTCWHLPK